MAVKNKMWHFCSIIIVILSCVSAKEKSKPISLNEDTWTKVLEGEWMVKFYAPWCPACKAMTDTWDKVASWSEDLSIQVADIDVTDNPGLSGRFLVTSLPTIYHVKDGEFRIYRGPRDETDFLSFVDEKKWKELEPASWYFHPNTFHMGAVAMFFKLSIGIRDLHNKMTEEFGIPVWGSYTIFALATILVGLLLGLIIVCLCDMVWPPASPQRITRRHPEQPIQHDDDDNESDVIEDDRYDALNSQPSTQPNVRRRVPKAD